MVFRNQVRCVSSKKLFDRPVNEKKKSVHAVYAKKKLDEDAYLEHAEG